MAQGGIEKERSAAQEHFIDLCNLFEHPILLLPLPFSAYKLLKFFLSLLLLYAAGFFLRPCKNLMFRPSVDRLEIGTRDPADGRFSGKLRDTAMGADIEELTKEIPSFSNTSHVRITSSRQTHCPTSRFSSLWVS